MFFIFFHYLGISLTQAELEAQYAMFADAQARKTGDPTKVPPPPPVPNPAG